MKSLKILGLMATAMLLTATMAQAQDRPATADENAMIQTYRSVINHVVDNIAATGAWTERQPNHFDIPDAPTVNAATEGLFYFYGDISRMYNSSTPPGPSRSDQIQAIMAKYMKATGAEKKALMQQMQDMAMAPVESDQPAVLLIMTAHNQPYVALDSDKPEAVDAPAGVARVWQIYPSQTVKENKACIIEFGDPKAFERSDPDQYTRYNFAHDDGSAHIENFEIRIEGPPAVVDNLLKTFDWTQADAALSK